MSQPPVHSCPELSISISQRASTIGLVIKPSGRTPNRLRRHLRYPHGRPDLDRRTFFSHRTSEDCAAWRRERTAAAGIGDRQYAHLMWSLFHPFSVPSVWLEPECARNTATVPRSRRTAKIIARRGDRR